MKPSDRRAYIDWARGVAVLLMIEAHTFDAWTRAADRSGAVFRDATVLGGFAAPLFLWLAGLSIPLAVSRAAARLGSVPAAARAVCRRGLEILVLAYIFRLQAFVLSPGSSPLMLFRVDILNIMGPAIAAAALMLAWPLSPVARAVTYGAIATTIALVTPVVRAAPAVDLLPLWLQWQVRPAGEYTNFTMFPWSGFVFAGAAAGVVVDRVSRPLREARALGWMAAAGAALVAIGLYTATRPAIYAHTSFWTSSPTYFAVRVGVLMLALAALFGLETTIGSAVFSSWLGRLATLGRHSLFIYWIHVELVYGYASWLWRGRLPAWGGIVAYVLFVALMYRTIAVKQAAEGWWRARRAGRLAETVAA